MYPVVEVLHAPLHRLCQISQAESIIGYMKNVSPCRLSERGSEYFSFNIVARTGTVKALCFSPKRQVQC